MKTALSVTLIGLAIGLCACSSTEANARPDGYSRTADPAQIKLYVTTSHCDELDAPTTKETLQRVTIEVALNPADPDDSCSTITPRVQVLTVTLNSPLGAREVRAPGLNVALPERPEQPAP